MPAEHHAMRYLFSPWLLCLAACGSTSTIGGGGSSGSGGSGGSGGTPDCHPPAAAELCADQSAACGSIQVVDSCGLERAIASCGPCSLPQVCGGGGIANQCGQPSGWYGVGGSDFTTWDQRAIWGSATGGGMTAAHSRSTGPAIADHPEGPITTWAGDGEILVAQWRGGAWQELGAGSAEPAGISNSGGGAWAPTIAVDSQDRVVIAWIQEVGDDEVYLRRWTGSLWEQLASSGSGGGISDTSSDSGQVALALDPTGAPCVAWSESGQVFLKKWDAGAWTALGHSATNDGLSQSAETCWDPALTIDASGDPIVAWSNGSQIFAKRWRGPGLGWVPAGESGASGGGISDSTDGAYEPVLAMSGGRAIVLWRDHYGVFLRRFDGEAWTALGEGSDDDARITGSSGQVWDISLALDPEGRPVVAWSREIDDREDVLLRRWDGASWQAVGGSGGGSGVSGSGRAASPAVTTDATGGIVVAWSNDVRGATGAGTSEIYARAWQDDDWVEMGSGSASGEAISGGVGDDLSPMIAMSDQQIIVAWPSHISSYTHRRVYLRRYDGATWQQLGAGSATGLGVGGNRYDASAPSLAVDAMGEPCMTWEGTDEETFDDGFYGRCWSGGAWQEISPGSTRGLGITGAPDTWPHYATLAFDGAGRPVVAWSASTFEPGVRIYIRRWTGTLWEELGVGSASGDGIGSAGNSASAPAVAIDSDGEPTVAWSSNDSGDYEIYLRRFTGGAWQQMGTSSDAEGGISDDDDASRTPSLAMGDDGDALISWVSRSAMDVAEIYVRQWDGSEWIEAGTGSATGEGVSQSGGTADGSDVAIGPAGDRILAWSQLGDDSWEIQVRRWDGTQWTGIAGSDTATGISNSWADSESPVIAVGQTHVCVAWSEAGGLSVEILLRCAQL